VRAGVWKPEALVRREAVGDQPFTSSRALVGGAKRGAAHDTQLDYQRRLRKHLLPFFADFTIAESMSTRLTAMARRR
jgi:hypothetical protein